MSYTKLVSKFPDQKLVRFISTTRDCPLSLKERWVYSTLLWRFKGKPVTKSRLARWTGVDRTRTLPRILTRLGNLRLVVNSDQKYRAVEPPSERLPWFATYIRGTGANERLVPSYNWAVYIRSRDIIDNLVACADALGHHAAAKLARRYGVCAKTITAARKRLAALNPQVDLLPALSVPPETAPKQIETAPPVTAEGPVEKPAAPIQQTSLEDRLAAQYAEYHGMEPDATKEIARLCQLLKGLSRKEMGQIVSALVAKYGVGEGLEEAVYYIIQRRYYDYRCGTTMERVLAHIGVGSSSTDDDDLCVVGEMEAEFATAV